MVEPAPAGTRLPVMSMTWSATSFLGRSGFGSSPRTAQRTYERLIGQVMAGVHIVGGRSRGRVEPVPGEDLIRKLYQEHGRSHPHLR